MVDQKEHKVNSLDKAGDVLKLLDSEGNSYTPEEAVDYQIIDENGKVLKEDTLKDTNEISLEGIETRDFQLIIDGHVVTEARGYNPPEDEKPAEPPEGPSFDFPDPSRLDFKQEDDDSDDESKSDNGDDDDDTDSKQSDSDDSDEAKDDSDSDDQKDDDNKDSDKQADADDEDSDSKDSDDSDDSGDEGSDDSNSDEDDSDSDDSSDKKDDDDS